MRKKTVYLLLFTLIASFSLIGINYYTIKILSAMRAYINGESEYSKGQKDALLYLYTYIETEDTTYLQLFDKALQVPISDNYARNSILQRQSNRITGDYFLKARNHADDVPNMIWLFKTFQSSFMKTPIRLWSEAEPLINKLYFIGYDVNGKIKKRSLSPADKMAAVKEISFISTELYQKESEFSQVLGDAARKINYYLFFANVFCIFTILGNIVLYATRMLRRLATTNRELKATNEQIIETNKELDTLVYSVSHDLRSPITSIQGLLGILKEETDKERIDEYIEIIDTTIRKQDLFILEIIDFFKNKRLSLSFKEFSLKDLIADVLANNKFTPQAIHITITQEIALDMVYSDELRMQMIINNLISNAIKYSDERKLIRTISIKTQKLNNNIVIAIADNGVGIDKKHLDKIYNMFFVTAHVNKGTGLGLYILKQNIEKLKGRVEVQSELGTGTIFTVYIPFADTEA